MAVQEPTAANVSLWTHYLEREWAAGPARYGPGEYVFRAVASAVAGWLTLTVAPGIAGLYRDNLATAEGHAFPSPAADEPAVPPQFQRRDAVVEPQTDAGDAKAHRRHYERRMNTSVGATSAATSSRDTAAMTHRGGGQAERPGSHE